MSRPPSLTRRHAPWCWPGYSTWWPTVDPSWWPRTTRRWPADATALSICGRRSADRCGQGRTVQGAIIQGAGEHGDGLPGQGDAVAVPVHPDRAAARRSLVTGGIGEGIDMEETHQRSLTVRITAGQVLYRHGQRADGDGRDRRDHPEPVRGQARPG